MSLSHDDLKKSILYLLKLQEIDAILFRLKEEQNKPSKDLQNLETEQAEAHKQLRIVERAWRQIERERRAYELKHITLMEDLKKAENKRKEVRNTKEEFAANKEFENTHRKASEVKALMEEKAPLVAEKSNSLEEKKKLLEGIEAKLKSHQEERQKRLEEVTTELEALESKRQQYISQVDDLIFSMYERVQKLRRGSGVAVVKDGICTGCHVSLPPQMKAKLNKLEEMFTCPSCSRILFPELLLEGKDLDEDDTTNGGEASSNSAVNA